MNNKLRMISIILLLVIMITSISTISFARMTEEEDESAEVMLDSTEDVATEFAPRQVTKNTVDTKLIIAGIVVIVLIVVIVVALIVSKNKQKRNGKNTKEGGKRVAKGKRIR